MPGNHYYVKYATAPWSFFAILWNSVYDMNLTLYENTLCTDKLFTEQADFNSLGKKKYGESQPYPIKNYSIYKSWINSKPRIKMLFMHATAICPRDDVSTGEAAFDLKWTDNKLQFGTFAFRRKEIIKDIEKGKLHIVLTGHSHRNMLFKVNKGCNHHPIPIGSEEIINTDFMEPANLVLITSSGGPLPKYLPGGPKICGCIQNNKYNTGFFVEGLLSKKLYRYKGDIDKALYNTNAESEVRGSHLKSYIGRGDKAICPHCHMEAGDMKDKKPRRHKPGGNLILFYNGKVKIRTEVSELKQNAPRKAVMCEEQDVFVDDMVVKDDRGYNESKKKYITNSTNIISKKPFKYYGYMEFPYQVEYITYKKPTDKGVKDLMRGGPTPHRVELVKVEDNKYKIRQGIGKKELKWLNIIAGDQKNYIFTRYKFKTNEIWDREIKVIDLSAPYKKLELTDEDRKRLDPEVVKAIEKERRHVRRPAHSVSDIVGERYQKKDIIIKFIKTPDFKKRRDVCGY